MFQLAVWDMYVCRSLSVNRCGTSSFCSLMNLVAARAQTKAIHSGQTSNVMTFETFYRCVSRRIRHFRQIVSISAQISLSNGLVLRRVSYKKHLRTPKTIQMFIRSSSCPQWLCLIKCGKVKIILNPNLVEMSEFRGGIDNNLPICILAMINVR